ncbi:hypothetical protein K523DRAFT_368883 [Schizophyllum commune Tattone D]|nr:hypothetical protein K523DRAFT_368883 [Schizophyllum commune Tattone D]
MSQTNSSKQKDPARRGQWKVELEQRLAGVEKIVAEGASIGTHAHDEQGEIQHRIDDYEKRVVELRDTLAKTTAALGVTTNDLQYTHTELQRHNIHIDNLRNGIIQLESQHQVLKAQHVSLLRQRDEAETQARRYRRLLGEYKQLVEDADQFRQDVRREMKETEERWQQKMATVTHELGALKAQSDTRGQETAALAREREALRRQLREERLRSVQTQTQQNPPAVASDGVRADQEDGEATSRQKSPPMQQPTPRATPEIVARPLKVDEPARASATNDVHTGEGTATQSTTFSQMPMCNPPTKTPASEDPRIAIVDDANDEQGRNPSQGLDHASVYTPSAEKPSIKATMPPAQATTRPSTAPQTPAPAMASAPALPVHTNVEAFDPVTPAVTTINYDGDDEQSPAHIPEPSPAQVPESSPAEVAQETPAPLYEPSPAQMHERSPAYVHQRSPAHIPDAASTAFSYVDLTRSPVPMAPPEPPADDPWSARMQDYKEMPAE